MSHAFSVEEIIRHPVPHVWTALTDWPNAHRWMPGIDKITADGETAEGQGRGVLWRLMSPLLRIAIGVSDGK
ncbi:SRPBCC family protein [Candidatus Poriferisodalis sp.]|uniref:SRPBCC family protein n=1 Tax=Candidatus Poriferisodalis sp. TaxID=3101277 RepID=UPI003AF823B1